MAKSNKNKVYKPTENYHLARIGGREMRGYEVQKITEGVNKEYDKQQLWKVFPFILFVAFVIFVIILMASGAL